MSAVLVGTCMCDTRACTCTIVYGIQQAMYAMHNTKLVRIATRRACNTPRSCCSRASVHSVSVVHDARVRTPCGRLVTLVVAIELYAGSVGSHSDTLIGVSDWHALSPPTFSLHRARVHMRTFKPWTATGANVQARFASTINRQTYYQRSITQYDAN
jgi:hypothetical protein